MTRDSRLIFRDPSTVLKLADFRLGKVQDDNQYVGCPYHADGEPSCSVHLTKQVFKCHGCGASGSLEQLIAKKYTDRDDATAVSGVQRIFSEYLEELETRTVDPSQVEIFHQRLLDDEAAKYALAQRKLLTEETIRRFSIGWNGKRYTLPVYDRTGRLVNVRQRSLEKGVKRKCTNLAGHSASRIYPIEVFKDAEIVIVTEGETKALLLCQMGFNAITCTGGAGGWDDGWNPLFVGKIVYLAFDIDGAGNEATHHIGRKLLKTAKVVYKVLIPLDKDKHPKGSIEDWIAETNATAADVQRLLDSAEKFAFESVVDAVQENAPVNTPLQLLANIGDVYDPALQEKHVEVEAVVAAEDTEPFSVPIKWKVLCDRNQKCCSDCPVDQLDQEEWSLTPWCRSDLLKTVDVPEEIRDYVLKDWVGIPRQCRSHKMKVLENAKVEVIELCPNLDNPKERESNVTVTTYFAQKENDKGETKKDRTWLSGLHTLRGFPTHDPKSGRMVFFAYDAQPAAESLDNFEVTEELDVALAATFAVPEGSTDVDVLDAKLGEIADDLAANVTRIYGRRDLHIFYDAIYHSVLNFKNDGKVIRGWIDALVIGDAGQGKSETMHRLNVHYGLGDRAVAGSSTVAGLLASVQESTRRRRWVVRWGKIPLNDRRLVIIEEAGTLPEVAIEKMRDARSSGVHEETKAKTARARARTRLAWIGNPRNGRPIEEYTYGVEALLSFSPNEADLRRFDFAMAVAKDDVPDEMLRKKGKRLVAHRATPDLGRALVLWAWSRRPDEVTIADGVVEHAKDLSEGMAKDYTSRIPLVIKSEQWEKLVRLGAAFAGRTYSTPDHGKSLLVQKQHVDMAERFLRRIYDAPSMNYKEYSRRVMSEANVDSDTVTKWFKGGTANGTSIPHAKSAVRWMLDTAGFTTRDLHFVTGLDFEECDEMVGELLRAHALKPGFRMANSYVKTPGLVRILKSLLIDDTVTDNAIGGANEGDTF